VNLFFRLLVVYLTAFYSKHRVDVHTPTKLSRTVWITDQDMFMHMTNSRYLSFTDLGTINYLIRAGFWEMMQKKKWYPIICGQQATITKMLKFPQRFDLITQVEGWDDTYICLTHTFQRNDRIHAQVRIVARIAAKDRQKVTTADVVEAMGGGMVSGDLPEECLRMIDRVNASRAAAKT